jgi:flavin-dependent dehydrogenase
VVLVGAERGAKPVRETLSPEAVRLLGEAGLAWCLAASCAIRSSGTTDAWHSPANPVSRSSISSPWGSAWHVDRGQLDATLRAVAVAVGVTMIDSLVETAVSTADGFRVGTASGLTVLSRELVDATGASARVARLLFVSRTIVDRQLVVFTNLDRALPEPALVVSSFSHGWLYLTTAGDMLTQLAILTDRDVLRMRGMRTVIHDALASVGLDAPTRDLPGTRVSGSLFQFVHGRYPAGFSAIGDAAWTPDPLSGHGVARAFHAALRLAAGAAETGPSPATLALDHLRERSLFCTSTPWAAEPYYRNRVRAYRRAQEARGGHSMEMG